MPYSYLDVEESKGVATVTINRPPANAINYEMIEELLSLTAELSSKSTVRVIVFSGTGDFFAGGADIKMMQEHKGRDLPSFMEAFTVHLQRAFNRIEEIPKPIIAAINGYAVGGGCEWALACDFRFMAKGKARIGLPEVKLGILPGAGGLQRLPRLVGKAKATEMIMTGMLLNAESALESGVVHKIFERDELMKNTQEYAEDLADQATLAMGMIKRCINYGVETSIKDGLAFDIECQDKLFHSEDGMEGIAAFIEKRKPIFRGR